VVHEAFKRYCDVQNQSPVYHRWQILEPGIESVRKGLAAEFGCDPEEMAVTPIRRNDYQGIRVTPNVYATLDEVDTFAQILEGMAKRGSV